jgi:uncharacterized protein
MVWLIWSSAMAAEQGRATRYGSPKGTKVRLSRWLIVISFLVLGRAAASATTAGGAESHSKQVSTNEQASQGTAAADPLDILGVKGRAHLEEGLLVPLRDGVQLVAMLVIPNGSSASSKHPAILIQTPYEPRIEFRGAEAILKRLLEEGYVLVVVFDRGTQWSEGEYHWLKGAGADGADAVRWITRQPWSNGSVGAWGCSSSGEVSLPLAKENPPGLKTIVAMAAATGVGRVPGFADQGVFYTGGVPLLVWPLWYRRDGYWHHPKLPPNLSQAERAALIHAFNPFYHRVSDLSWVGHLPSEDLLTVIGSPQTEFNALIRMHPADPGWQSYDFLRTGDLSAIPMLLIDTWYDSYEVYGTTKAYEYLARSSPNQYMIIGPGEHCSFGNETEHTLVGPRPVGDARFDYTAAIVGWFDHWMGMKEEDTGWRMPRVQYYPLESNHWVSTDSWPPPYTPRRYYLMSKGHANSSAGDGRLDAVLGNGAPDQFRDDPLNPVPSSASFGGFAGGAALDQSEIERRRDVLVYTSPPLTSSLKIAGYLKAVLYFSTSVPDTDLAVKFVDVYPDGKAYNVLDTIERLRYRDGVEKEVPMQKGKVYKLTLSQMVTASSFAAGHRLRIEIAGTNFPKYERNLNTGGNNFDEDKPLIAEDVIYHDRRRSSFLQLPVVR